MSELKCTLKTIRPIETGTSKAGKDYQTQYFKVEYQDGQYNAETWFKLFGSKIGILDGIAEGTAVKVEFNPTSREWNEKIFTENNAWRITKLEPAATPVPAAPPAHSPAPAFPVNADEPHDDLPF